MYNQFLLTLITYHSQLKATGIRQRFAPIFRQCLTFTFHCCTFRPTCACIIWELTLFLIYTRISKLVHNSVRYRSRVCCQFKSGTPEVCLAAIQQIYGPIIYQIADWSTRITMVTSLFCYERRHFGGLHPVWHGRSSTETLGPLGGHDLALVVFSIAHSLRGLGVGSNESVNSLRASWVARQNVVWPLSRNLGTRPL